MTAKSFGLGSSGAAKGTSGALMRRVVLWAIAICGFVLLVAWIDGGEEPLRTIVEPIDVPAQTSVQASGQVGALQPAENVE